MKIIDDNTPKEYILGFLNIKSRGNRNPVALAIGLTFMVWGIYILVFFIIENYILNIILFLCNLYITYRTCRYALQKNLIKKEIQKYLFFRTIEIYFTFIFDIASFFILRSRQNTSYILFVLMLIGNALTSWAYFKIMNYAVKRGYYAGNKERFVGVLINAPFIIVTLFWFVLLPFLNNNTFLESLFVYNFSILFSFGSPLFLKSYYIKYLEQKNDTYGIEFE